MPIYTYRCENCGVQFERHQSFTEPPLTRCPECSKRTLRKIYTPVGIVFKGSGFYSTDHRSPSGATRNSGTKATDTETKTEVKAESKSETQSATTTNKTSED